jgi:hypothetical protein
MIFASLKMEAREGSLDGSVTVVSVLESSLCLHMMTFFTLILQTSKKLSPLFLETFGYCTKVFMLHRYEDLVRIQTPITHSRGLYAMAAPENQMETYPVAFLRCSKISIAMTFQTLQSGRKISILVAKGQERNMTEALVLRSFNIRPDFWTEVLLWSDRPPTRESYVRIYLQVECLARRYVLSI